MDVVALVVVVLWERAVFEVSELIWVLKAGPSARAKAGWK